MLYNSLISTTTNSFIARNYQKVITLKYNIISSIALLVFSSFIYLRETIKNIYHNIKKFPVFSYIYKLTVIAISHLLPTGIQGKINQHFIIRIVKNGRLYDGLGQVTISKYTYAGFFKSEKLVEPEGEHFPKKLSPIDWKYAFSDLLENKSQMS